MVFLVKLSKHVAGEVNKSGNATSDQNVQQREARLNLTIYLVYPGFELHYCINIKEFSICIFLQVFYLYFELCNALHCFLGVMEISVKNNGECPRNVWQFELKCEDLMC